MTRTERDYRRVCTAVGLTNVQIVVRGKHWAITATEGIFFCATTPSDQRNLKHVRASARRIVRLSAANTVQR